MSQRLPLVILIAAAGVLVGTAAWHWRDLASLGAPLAMIGEVQRITERGAGRRRALAISRARPRALSQRPGVNWCWPCPPRSCCWSSPIDG